MHVEAELLLLSNRIPARSLGIAFTAHTRARTRAAHARTHAAIGGRFEFECCAHIMISWCIAVRMLRLGRRFLERSSAQP